jgi:hypothetical protein
MRSTSSLWRAGKRVTFDMRGTLCYVDFGWVLRAPATDNDEQSVNGRLLYAHIADYLLWLGSLVLALDEYRSFNLERPGLRTFTIRAADA